MAETLGVFDRSFVLRADRALYLRGVRTMGDLLELSDTELLAIPGIGEHGVTIIADARARYAADQAGVKRAG
ncbi:hypothetical protein [Nocardia sp. NPDC004711]